MTESLVCTNENCVACNRCVSACSCPGATIATVTAEGRNIIAVDGAKCIACGACIDVCEHHARQFVDDTAAFFDDLKRGEKISILFAPALAADYPKDYLEILGKLKTLGAGRFISVAFGADITTWGYLNYIEKYHFAGAISQPCPAVVDYIEKYIPELIPKLMPVQSPMMCAAIYARKHMGLTEKMAFIGPCIAKKKEIESERGKGLISYNVTFDHMMKTLRTLSVEPSPVTIETASGLGSVYSMPGGLKDNVSWFLGKDAFIRSVEGEKAMYRYLEENKARILDEHSPYTLLDVLNCSKGCLCGTGVEAGTSSEDTLIRMMEIRREHVTPEGGNAWSESLSPKERLEELNRQFQELDLKDYLCYYTDRSQECAWKYPNDAELDAIFEDMNKNTAADRTINCGACGYNSCREMAVAIFNGFNHKENCIHFAKSILDGLSVDCPTVVVIHASKQTMHLVKCAGKDAIQGWIESDLSRIDYNSAIRDYIDRYVDEGDRDRLWAEVEFSALMQNLAADGSFSITYTRHAENGNSGFFQLNFTKAAGHDDIILTFRDVDAMIREEQEKEEKLRQALEAAEAANIAKNTFLANMSHEFRTPINAILGMDTMILRESREENIQEYARNVEEAGNKLLSLVSFLLDYSKKEASAEEETASTDPVQGENQESDEAFQAPEALVLAVDDVEMNLMVLKNLLKKTRIVPDTCLSGERAVELAREKQYDLILMDAMMPGMSGVETLRAIRKESPLNAKTPAIVVTANAVAGAREEYMQAGFDEFLSKPVDGLKLDRMIRSYLPPEKIQAAAEEKVQDTLTEEQKKILEILGKEEILSVEKGIEAAGDAETYISVSQNFYDTAQTRMGMIQSYFEGRDIPNYTIQVHALKSSARLVGAVSLSAHALELEMAGKEGNTGKILAETEELLTEYKTVVQSLSKAYAGEEDESKPLLPAKKFKRRMSELMELVDAFDFETAKQLFEDLGKYRFEEEDKAVYQKLKAMLADVDRDGILALLNEI